MQWTGILAMLVVVACGLPGGASNSAADVITPSQASQVVASYWTQNEKANMAGDPALYVPIEAGPALTFDQAQAMRDTKLNRHLAQPRPLRKVTVYVPHQSRYPAEFAARTDTVGTDANGNLTTRPSTFFNVFEKGSVSQAWKLTFWVYVALGEAIKIVIGNDGYVAQVAGTGGGQAVPPVQMGEIVANYLNSATVGLGVDDSKLDGAPLIDALARLQRLSIESARRAGITLTLKAAPGPGGSHAYLSEQGRAVAFFAVSILEVATAARAGACIVQDERLRLPPEVPPGNYSRVEDKGLALLVAADPPATKGKATVLGIVSLDYDYLAEPASGPCTDNGPPTSV